jgi:hypothetical protein
MDRAWREGRRLLVRLPGWEMAGNGGKTGGNGKSAGNDESTQAVSSLPSLPSPPSSSSIAMSLSIFIRSPNTFSERKFPSSLTINALKVRPPASFPIHSANRHHCPLRVRRNWNTSRASHTFLRFLMFTRLLMPRNGGRGVCSLLMGRGRWVRS